MIETLIPSVFVATSFLIVLIIMFVSLPILKRFGVSIPGWKPFRELSPAKKLIMVLFNKYDIKLYY